MRASQESLIKENSPGGKMFNGHRCSRFPRRLHEIGKQITVLLAAHVYHPLSRAWKNTWRSKMCPGFVSLTGEAQPQDLSSSQHTAALCYTISTIHLDERARCFKGVAHRCIIAHTSHAPVMMANNYSPAERDDYCFALS